MACVWRCRTIALSPNPNKEVQFTVLVNLRKRLNQPLPEGYYGNVLVLPMAVAAAEKLMKNPLDYSVDLVRKIKSDAMEEYMRSVMDLMAIDHPNLAVARSYIAADHTHSGLDEIDYGWGKAAYGGTATVGIPSAPGLVSFATPFKNKNGEDEIVVPICLPLNAMDVFAEELQKMLMAARKGLKLTASAL